MGHYWTSKSSLTDTLSVYLYESVEKEKKVKINAIKGMEPKNILSQLEIFNKKSAHVTFK